MTVLWRLSVSPATSVYVHQGADVCDSIYEARCGLVRHGAARHTHTTLLSIVYCPIVLTDIAGPFGYPKLRSLPNTGSLLTPSTTCHTSQPLNLNNGLAC